MQVPHSLDNLQCVRELQCPQTKRRIFQAQPPALFQPQSLAMGVPLLLFSAVTFFVSFNSGAAICHRVPHKPSQFVDSQASLSVCLVQLSLAQFIHGNAQNCSCSIMMTDEDSLSHATCKRADTVFSNFTKQTFSPNCAIGFHHLRPVLLSSLVFPSLPILILFMTCAAMRGSQLSNGLSSAIRTPVLCSAEILRVLHSISTRPLAT